MRLSLIAVSILIFANSLFAESIAFLSNLPKNPEHTAIMYGATKMFDDLQLRYRKQFSVQDITPEKTSISVEDQIIALENAAKAGFMGAILIPVDSTSSKLKQTIKNLREKKFYVSLLKKDIPDSERILFLSSDEEQIKKLIDKACIINHSKAKLEILSVFFGEDDRFMKDDKEFASLEKYVNANILAHVKTKGDFILASSKFFSVLSNKYRDDIKRFDCYGIVFFDSMPLIDMTLLDNDFDRAFVITLDILPHLVKYLEHRQVTLAIGDDYIGFGLLSAQRITEAFLESKIPTTSKIKLDPVYYTPEDVEQFEKDWTIFMQ